MAFSTIDALYNGTSEKLTTSATGIDVTGTVTGSTGITTGVNHGNFTPVTSGTTGARINANGNGMLRLASGGVDKMYVLDSGNVGIGTSSPSLGSNGTGLHIKGASGDYGVLKVDSSTTSEEGWVQFSNNGVDKFRIASDSSTNLKFIHSGVAERMRIESSGAVTKPYQPAFLAFPTSGTQNNIAINTDVNLVLANEVFDQNNDFASNTFTAPVTGKYQLNAALRLQNMDVLASYYQMHIKTSNRIYRSIISMDGFDSNIALFTMEISSLCDMDAGDTAYVSIHQSGGSSVTDLHSESQFSGHLVA